MAWKSREKETRGKKCPCFGFILQEVHQIAKTGSLQCVTMQYLFLHKFALLHKYNKRTNGKKGVTTDNETTSGTAITDIPIVSQGKERGKIITILGW